MRFPWLQVDADFIAAHAGDLGAHLGISRREAIGMAVDLWTWALARAPDDAPPDGLVTGTGPVPDRLLSGSVGWAGPVEQFTSALVACGLAVKIHSGYRLTGFSRYKATWEKNRRRSGEKPDRNRTGTGEDPARKTQTQTQTQKETTDHPPSAVASAAPEQRSLLSTDDMGAGSNAPAAGQQTTQPNRQKRPATPRKAPAEPKTTDPRHTPLIASLTAEGWPFDGGKDAAHVKALLALADQQEATRGELAGLEVLRRARIAWSQFPDFHSARTLSGLRAKWGEFVAPLAGGTKTRQQEIWDGLQERRRAALEAVGQTCAPELATADYINATLARWKDTKKGEDTEELTALGASFIHFCEEPRYLEKGLPVKLFLSPGVLAECEAKDKANVAYIADLRAPGIR